MAFLTFTSLILSQSLLLLAIKVEVLSVILSLAGAFLLMVGLAIFGRRNADADNGYFLAA